MTDKRPDEDPIQLQGVPSVQPAEASRPDLGSIEFENVPSSRRVDGDAVVLQETDMDSLGMQAITPQVEQGGVVFIEDWAPRQAGNHD